MNHTNLEKILVLLAGLGLHAVFSNITYAAGTILDNYKQADAINRYTLPTDKTQFKSCRQNALLFHPGVIEKQQMLHRHGNFWVRYEIQARGGAEWFTLCDLAAGKIIREQKLADDEF